MATAIQVIVAGTLLAAWLWVLGRPLLIGNLARSDLEEVPRRPNLFMVWRQRPVEHRRRQLMLSTMLAAFGSFFLAIALRGSFVPLFLLMMVVLAVHVAIASRIGAQLAPATPQAGESSEAPGFMAGIPKAEHITAPPAVSAPASVGDDSRPRSAFEVVAELVAELGSITHGDEAAIARQRFVAELIESEWGPVTPSEEDDRPQPELPETPQPIFTRAAKDERPGAKRKARPIHIHSHLDDGDRLPPARAVNDG